MSHVPVSFAFTYVTLIMPLYTLHQMTDFLHSFFFFFLLFLVPLCSSMYSDFPILSLLPPPPSSPSNRAAKIAQLFPPTLYRYLLRSHALTADLHTFNVFFLPFSQCRVGGTHYFPFLFFYTPPPWNARPMIPYAPFCCCCCFVLFLGIYILGLDCAVGSGSGDGGGGGRQVNI